VTPAVTVLVLALQVVAQEPPAGSEAQTYGVSLSRVRQALERPQRLHVDLPEPTFKVEVRGHRFFTDLPFTWTFEGGGVPFAAPQVGTSGSPPLVKGDVLPLLSRARKAMAARAAQRDAERAIREYCATTRECEVR
jgi:hypothetical protein